MNIVGSTVASRILLITFASSSVTPTVLALKCGQWNTHDCLGKTDKRYDPDSTNNLKELNSIWGLQEGLWVGRKTSDIPPSQIDISDLSTIVGGLPYAQQDAYVFLNVTIHGSRRTKVSNIVVKAADQTFCDKPVEPPLANALGAGQCGVNGYSYWSDNYQVSSYEKDGSLLGLGSALGFAVENTFVLESVDYEVYPVGDKTITSHAQTPGNREDGGKAIVSESWVFLDDDNRIANSHQTLFSVIGPFDNPILIGMSNVRYEKYTSEAAFKNKINETWDEYNVPEVDRVLSPVGSDCGGKTCPTEEQWCTLDPKCSESPYQEPPAYVRAGVIVGFSVGGAAILLLISFFIYRSLLQKQKRRTRRVFAARIAETIELRQSTNMMVTPEALKAEFEKIDTSSDGFISKSELWEFLSLGQAGEMNKKDFDALFGALDVDNSGQVDFLEFCHFLSQCGAEMNDAIASLEKNFDNKQSKGASFMRASVALNDKLGKLQSDEENVVN
mmetsp:Transcript_17592/g.20035  ORF Transcript_17592/g.20035 Transcript_17592/m.20035 type:complete len:501 (+) Transcript_17592:38-1540(+)